MKVVVKIQIQTDEKYSQVQVAVSGGASPGDDAPYFSLFNNGEK